MATGLLTGTLHAMNVCNMKQQDGKILLRSYMDSGAARSVCPRKFGDQFEVRPTLESRRGDGFQTATGKRVPNLGGRVVKGLTEAGSGISMRYAVADVQSALDSISQICDGGSTVTFTKTGGWIQKPNGSRTNFVRDRDTYIRETWVTPAFSRPT